MNPSLGIRAFPILALLLLLVVPASGQGAKDPEGERVLTEARARLAEDGVEGAVEFLRSREKLTHAMAGFLDLQMHLYWKKKSLPRVVALSRAGIRHGRKAAEEQKDPEIAARIKGSVKALAYNLASFTWPGWGLEGIEIRREDREAGFEAAKLNLELAKELGKGPGALSNSLWVLGAHYLAADGHEASLDAFERARDKAKEGKNPLGALMCEGYAGIAMMLSGANVPAGERRFRAAVAALREDGSGDAKFYADQLWTAVRALGGSGSVRPETRTERIECGRLVLNVALSRTAHLFHIVDQLSQWDVACHRQYELHMKLDDEDQAALARYAEIRRRKGWGGGLEQTFYTTSDLDAALFAGAEAGRISPEEADVLRKVLSRFIARIDALYSDQRQTLERFVAGLDRERLTRIAEELSEFLDVEGIEVPVFPIANPDPEHWGGGYNGERLVLEIPPGRDITTTVIHELAHAFFRVRRDEIKALADRTPGLSMETLNEGLAYAYADGLRHAEKGDPLTELVAGHLEHGRGLDDPTGYARSRMCGLALRPLLAESLGKEKLADFLPRARDAWLVLSALERALEARGRLFFCAGPGWKVARERVEEDGVYGFGYSTNHSEAYYDTLFSRARPGDLLVLFVAGDNADRRIPAKYAGYLPLAPEEIHDRIQGGGTVAVKGAFRGVAIVVLAAPKLETLLEMIRRSPLLGE